MKKVFKKILIIMLIILTLNNFLMSDVYAEDKPGMMDAFEEKLANFFGSVVGLFTWPVRFVAIAASIAINTLTASVAYIEGANDAASTVNLGPFQNITVLTPFDIFFNKVAILDVNFFDFSSIEEGSLIYTIRTGIATWYYILRILAASILLVVLIYVGIRMAISTVATDKAMYKKMLVDWVCSLAIIFLIHYIIIFTITISNALVNAVSLTVNSETISNTYAYIQQLALRVFDLESIPATIIFCMLVWQTFGLLISYFNRMLKTAFLVIISPLITLTYSIDKMGDGKAQALGAWLKEFVYTILMQPVHCIIYMCFINIALSLLIEKQGNGVSRETIAVAIISLLCVKFVKDAENLVRKIFRFEDDGTGSLGAGLAVAGLALNNAKGIGKGARSAINNTRNFVGNTVSTARGMKIGALALGRRWLTNEGRSGTYAEAKESVRIKSNEKKAAKINKKYGDKGKDIQERAERIQKESIAKGREISKVAALKAAQEEKLNDEVNKRAQKIKNDYGGYMSDDEAKSIARLNIAKERRTQNSKPRKFISGAKGKINSFKSAVGQSETLKALGGLGKATISAGLGVAVGSGVAGVNDSILTGIMAGAAMYKGSQGFMNSSSKTIADSMNQNFKALGVKNAAEMSSRTAKIMQMFSDEDRANQELSKIMDELEKALQHAGIDGKLKTNIKNTIEGGIKADPSRTNDIINYALKGVGIKPGDDSNTSISNVRKATQKLADFTNESQIYQSIQAAGDIGLEADTIIGEAMGRFVPDNSTTINNNYIEIGSEDVNSTENINTEYEGVAETVSSAVLDSDNYDTNMEIAGKEAIVTSESDIIALLDELKREKKEEMQKLLDEGLDQSTLKEIEKDIDRANTDMISRALADLERQYVDVKKEIKDDIKMELERSLQEAQNEVNSMSMDNPRYNLLQSQITRFQDTKAMYARYKR